MRNESIARLLTDWQVQDPFASGMEYSYLIFLLAYLVVLLTVNNFADGFKYGSVERSSRFFQAQQQANSPRLFPVLAADMIDGESAQFLKSIRDYGDARMARRAIQILNNMQEKGDLQPTELHYTATIQACQNSDQYEAALKVFHGMKERGVSRTISTYEALVAGAEKAGKWEDCVKFLDSLQEEKLSPTTNLYNNCMWAADSARHPKLALQLLQRMEKENVKRDMATYEAALWACEKEGEADQASHIIDLMRADGYEPNTATLRCVGYHGGL